MHISTFLERSDPTQLHVCLPPDFDSSYYSTDFFSIFCKNLHGIECLTASGWQIAPLEMETFPNVREISFYDDDNSWEENWDGVTRPLDINVSKFPRLEAIDSIYGSWLNVATPSPDRFPNLLRLSLSADAKSMWFKIIKYTARTLESLFIRSWAVHNVPGDFVLDLPALKSLETSNFPHNTPWLARITTPSLISYKAFHNREGFFPHYTTITTHTDVGSVTHLRMDIIPNLS